MSKKLNGKKGRRSVTRRGFVRLLAAASIFTPSRGYSEETDFPSRAIRIINPFAPGGNTDIVGRLLATHLSNAWGQPVVVENRPGAGATLGTDLVAKSLPDGYTLLIATLAATAIAPSVYRKLPYDPEKDLASISGLTIGHSAIGISPGLPIHSLKEFVEYARARPDQMFYSSPGIGVSSHLAMENFARLAGLKLTHVPYRGSAQALTAVMTGEVQVIFDPISTLASFARNGNIRALAVSGSARSSLLPDVPTLEESGYPNVKSSAWTGLMAPTGTPAAAIRKIRSSVENLLETDDFRTRAAAMANQVLDLSPDRFAQFVHEEARAWGTIARSVGVSLD